MPELSLLERGKPIAYLPEYLRAIMLTPRDPASAQTFFALSTGPRSPLRDRLVRNHEQAAGRAGRITGLIFYNALKIRISMPSVASMAKAIDLVSTLVKGARNEKGHALSSEESRLRRTWREYAPAAHMWCAELLLPALFSEPPPLLGPNPKLYWVELLLGLTLELEAQAKRAGFEFHNDPWRIPTAYPATCRCIQNSCTWMSQR